MARKTCECGGKEVISERVKQWREYADAVEDHLNDYTVPQYGDVGSDEITDYSVETCVEQVKKYSKRYGTQSRSGQQELDFLKMGHYSQCAWEKYKNQPVAVEIGILGRMVVVDSEEDIEIVKSGSMELDSILSDGMGNDFHFWKEKQ